MNQAQMMAQVRKMQQEMTKAQEELANTVVTGNAAGEAVRVKMTCDHRVKSVKIAVEAMDIIFAIDSVPAVLAITRNVFIVYSSNAFAILGLRALYFALAGILPRFRFLHQGLAILLFFIGGKMILSDWVHITAPMSLAVIGGILGVTIAASLLIPEKKKRVS